MVSVHQGWVYNGDKSLLPFFMGQDQESGSDAVSGVPHQAPGVPQQASGVPQQENLHTTMWANYRPTVSPGQGEEGTDDGGDSGAGSMGEPQRGINKANLVRPSTWIPQIEKLWAKGQVFKPMPDSGFPPAGVMRPAQEYRARSTKKIEIPVEPIDWDESEV